MAISFKDKPYYDDFDPSKNFHRVLFKPGFAVQSRELTQLQTVLQHQISSFADNIFVKNTPVSGGNITVNTKCYYLKLNNTYNGEDVVAENFKNRIITDETGTILATVIATAEATGTDVAAGDPPTLIVTYLSGQQFTDGELIVPTDGSNFRAITVGTVDGTTCTGPSSVASISEGTFYVRNGYFISPTINEDGTNSKYSIGHFVVVLPQTIILDKYGATPTYRVGLNINETVEDYIGDPSLLDPAVGASNYQAPGADRYKIVLTLDKLPMELGNDDNYIELVRLESGNIIRQVNTTVYSTINDYIAKRTYDTNGDFIVNDFSLTPVANTVNGNKYDLRVGKGVAFVGGYRLENQSDLTLTNDRARSTFTLENNYVSVDYGSYFYVDNLSGVFDTTTSEKVDLHIVSSSDIISTNTKTYTSTLVGSGHVRGLTYYDNTTDSNTISYVFRLYLHDITTNSLSGQVISGTSTTAVVSNDGTFTSVNDAYIGATISIDSGTGKGFATTVSDWDGATNTFTVNPAFTVTPDSTTKFSLTFGTKDVESIVTTGVGYSIDSSAEISTEGKQGNSPTGYTILENPGVPELIYTIGNPYVAAIENGTYSSTRMFRNYTFGNVGGGVVSLAIALPPGLSELIDFSGGVGTLSSDAVKNHYTIIVTNSTDTANNGPVGSVLDFCSSGNTVSISSDKNTLTLTSTKYKTPLTVTVIGKVNINNADATDKFLKQKTLITGDMSSVSYAGPDGIIDTYTKLDLTKGQVYIQNAGLVKPGNQQSLYISDVKSIKKIIDTKSPGTVPTLSMLTDSAYDVTSYYSFSNGQKDSIYDHASLTLVPGAPQPKGNILVVLNYYDRSAADGYFSLESYLNETYAEIPTYVAKNGKVYQLRDCLDFRPTRKNATKDYVVDTGTNPATTDGGYFIPQDLSNWISDYGFYQGRKDKLVLSKDGNFQIIKGTPSVNPSMPSQPDGSLLLAYLTHDPYTSYLPSEAPKGFLPNLSLEKVLHKRWAMRDISDLQTRVNNIEYYAALNLLEQNAQSLQIPDANGLNRFKNGILVDDFSTYGVADTYNPDFCSSIDKVKKRMSALQLVDNYPLKSLASLRSLGVPGTSASTLGYKISQSNSSKMICLPYDKGTVITQKLASETLKANPFNSNITRGIVTLNPPMDNWVDNSVQPDILLVDSNLNIYRQGQDINSLNVGNWQTIPGTQYNLAKTKTTIGGTNISSSPYYVSNSSQNNQNSVGQSGSVSTSTLGSSYNITTDYITDVGVQAYMRQQDIIFRGKGLKINTPVNIYFDGVKVNENIIAPNVLELQDCTGTFKEDDVIGFIDTRDNVFNPIAAVVGMVKDGAKQRLYITGDVFTPKRVTSTTLITNAKFDENGNYISGSATASGKVVPVTTTSEIPITTTASLKSSGTIASVGGSFVDVTSNTVVLVSVDHSGWKPFLREHAIWAADFNPNSTTENLSLLVKPKMDVTLNVSFPETAEYTFAGMADDTGKIYLDGSQVLSISSYNTLYQANVSVTAGIHTIRMTGNDTQENAGLACTIAKKTTPKNLIFDTRVPSEITPVGGGNRINMPGGGAFYTGVTQVNLGIGSSEKTDFYVGAKISFTSIYVSQPQDILLTKAEAFAGRTYKDTYISSIGGGLTRTYIYSAIGEALKNLNYKKETFTDTATITAWNPSTKVATLDVPVRLSLGTNKLINSTTNSTWSVEGTSIGQSTSTSSSTSYTLSVAKGTAPALTTNENGEIYGIFRVPKEKFRTGFKSFYIDNRTNETKPETATTWAEGLFISGSLNYKILDDNFSPSLSSDAIKIIESQKETFTSLGINTALLKGATDPLAQTFIIDKGTYPDGIFLSSIKLFFKSKPTTSKTPVMLKICQTENNIPTGKTLDYSTVVLTSDDVKTSSSPHYLDNTTATEFEFDFPVYIEADKKYAMIITSASSDYALHVAAQNSNILPSTAKNNPTDPTPTTITKISSQPYVGSIYESQNGGNWKADDTKALMFVVTKCVFDTSIKPKVPFVVPGNAPAGQISHQILNPYYTGLNYDTLGITSGIDIEYHSLNVTTTDYVPAKTAIDYSYRSTLLSTMNLTDEYSINPGKLGAPTFDNEYLDDGKGTRVLKTDTDNSFILYATLSSTDPNVSPFISDDGLRLYVQRWGINNLELANNYVVLNDGGSGYTQGTTSVTIGPPTVPGGTQAYASAVVDGGAIQYIYFTTSGSGYLYPPTITITDSGVSPGSNANASIITEFSPSGGNGIASYVTKKTTLTSGNDSGDLRVFFTAYRPVGTNIYVFYRIQNREDNQTFEEAPWQLMTYVNNTGNGYSLTRENLLEFETAPGINGYADNQVSYTSVNGTTYSRFNQFAIKIVLTTEDDTNVPFLTDIRTLALPPGTGL